MIAESIIPGTAGDARLYIALTLAVVIISLITALVGLATAVRTARRAARNVEEIRVNVNSHLSEQVERVDQLTKALNVAGINVPTVPSKAVTPDTGVTSESAS
jgi:uncharacterized membrane protein